MQKIYIMLSHEIIWLNKTYGDHLSRKENTKAKSHILQDEDDSYNWDHIKLFLSIINTRRKQKH